VTDQVNSYRRILKSTSIIGSASIINVLTGMLRTKVLALLLGASGLGLASLYTSLMATAAVVASLGVGTVGTKQVAEAMAMENPHALAVTRRAMFWGTLILAITGGGLVWTLRGVLAEQVLGSAKYSQAVGWLALGVTLSVVAASQGALIQGMRRIGDLARLSIFGALANTVVGIGILWRWGMGGIWLYVIVGPLASVLLGYVYVSKLPTIDPNKVKLRELREQWNTLARLGFPFVGAGLVQTLVSLWIRVSVNDGSGIDAVGHFQAASAISMQYVGFVLSAMAADYYPRLVGTINDHAEATRLVNEQTEVALLLTGPVFIAMMGLAPWVIQLLYSSAFSPAVEVLRWQILGDVLKVTSWPLGFVILATGAGKTFFWTEAATFILMGGIVALFEPTFGLRITGIAFLTAYIFYLPLIYIVAQRQIFFSWNPTITRLILTVISLTVIVALVSTYTQWGPPISIILSSMLTFYSIAHLKRRGNISGIDRKLFNINSKTTSNREH